MFTPKEDQEGWTNGRFPHTKLKLCHKGVLLQNLKGPPIRRYLMNKGYLRHPSMVIEQHFFTIKNIFVNSNVPLMLKVFYGTTDQMLIKNTLFIMVSNSAKVC